MSSGEWKNIKEEETTKKRKTREETTTDKSKMRTETPYPPPQRSKAPPAGRSRGQRT